MAYETRPTTARNHLLPAAVIVFCCFLAYVNALGNGFVYDDVPQVLRNPWILEPGHLGEIFGSNVWAFAGMKTNYYRPLMHVGYLLCRGLFGLAPWGFHLVNVLLHAGCSLLVYAVCGRLVPVGEGEAPRLQAPLIAAILFACHPIHTEVVAWIGGFTDLSYTFFCLVSLYLLIRADADREWPTIWQAFAAVSFFLATLCKEPAVLFLAVIAAYDFLWNRRRLDRGEFLARYLPLLAGASLYFVLRFNALGSFSPVRRHEELSTGGAILNVFPLFAEYLEKLLLPVNLNAWHVFHPVLSAADPRFLVSLLACVAFLLLGLWAARRDRFSLLALVLIVVPLLPTLYVPAMGENPFAERYLYLPSAGFVMLAGYWLLRLTARRPQGERLALAICGVLAVLYLAGTLTRNSAWKDDVSFWSDTVKHSPEGPVPHYNLGTALAERGAYREAVAQYQTAIAIQPAAVAYKSLGAAYLALGDRNAAIRSYLEAIRMEPSDAAARNELGNIYAEGGDPGRAIEQFEEALRLDPDSQSLRNNLEEARRRLQTQPR